MTWNKKNFDLEVIVWEPIFWNFGFVYLALTMFSDSVDLNLLLKIIGYGNDLYVIAFNIDLFDFTSAEAGNVST